MIGPDRAVPPLRGSVGVRPTEALAAVLRRALRRPPCMVSFSGGRDSSGILALACRIADRDGLDRPIAVTGRFGPGAAEEDAWQEQVIRHLGPLEWERIDLTGAADLLGPLARQVMQTWGPVWPATAHSVLPLLAPAAGGTLLTGNGGDELFWLESLASVAARAVGGRGVRHAGQAIALKAVPPAIRRTIIRRATEEVPWLTAEGNRRLLTPLLDYQSQLPVRWSQAVRTGLWRDRSRTSVAATLQALGSRHDVAVVHPFQDPAFLASAARAHRWTGFGSRDAAMKELFGDVLPREVLERKTKALFNEAFFTEESRRFAAEWDGTGADPALVRVDALRRVWLSRPPDGRTFAALQAAWWATGGHGPGPAEPLAVSPEPAGRPAPPG